MATKNLHALLDDIRFLDSFDLFESDQMTVSAYDDVGLCFYRAVHDGVVVWILSHNLMCLRRIADYRESGCVITVDYSRSAGTFGIQRDNIPYR